MAIPLHGYCIGANGKRRFVYFGVGDQVRWRPSRSKDTKLGFVRGYTSERLVVYCPDEDREVLVPTRVERVWRPNGSPR